MNDVAFQNSASNHSFRDIGDLSPVPVMMFAFPVNDEDVVVDVEEMRFLRCSGKKRQRSWETTWDSGLQYSSASTWSHKIKEFHHFRVHDDELYFRANDVRKGVRWSKSKRKRGEWEMAHWGSRRADKWTPRGQPATYAKRKTVAYEQGSGYTHFDIQTVFGQKTTPT